MSNKSYDTELDIQQLTIASIRACADGLLANITLDNKLSAEDLKKLDRIYYDLLDICHKYV